ncbi:MAG: class A beta-lactamase-related serine hydrolase [Balneolaceae bacterium]|nr:MAG: class A beta-lactamase-related serine hydrolase [Balneolaceae bacterium]
MKTPLQAAGIVLLAGSLLLMAIPGLTTLSGAYGKAGSGITLPVTGDVLVGRAWQEGGRGTGSHDDWAGYMDLQMTLLLASQNLPNAVAALVSGDEIHLLAGYGMADMESQEEVDPAYHLFRTGSVAKIFTWTAIMQLYERGLLDLEEDIRNHLEPDFDFPVRFGGGDAAPITFEHLLTHTAGFEDVLEDLFTFEPQAPLGEYIRRHQPARIFPPGTVMAYSNYGTALAGYIVERIAGMPFDQYVADNIFVPLGMQHSTMEQPPPGALADRLVTPYRWVGDRFMSGRFEHMPSPAGGLSTSAADMARFLQANLGGGTLDREPAPEPILQKETMQQMHTPLFTHHPLLGGMAYGYKEFKANGYQVIFHGGSSSVFDAGFYLIPELDLGLFLAYSGGTYAGHGQVFRALLEHFFPEDDDGADPHVLADTLTPVSGAPVVGDLTGEYFQSRTIATGPDRLLNLIMGTLFVTPVDEQRFSVVILGEEFVYEELVPGIYRNTRKTGIYPFGPLRYLVAGRAPDGSMMLMTDGPLTYIRAPWYGGSVMALAIFAPMLLLAAGSLVFLLAAFVVRNVRGWTGAFDTDTGPDTSDNRSRPAAGYVWLSAHALVLLITVFLVMLYGQPHPVHLLPESSFTPRNWMDVLLDLLPFAVALLGLAVSWTAVRSWMRRDRGIFFRIHGTVYAVWSLALIWFFYYWGLLGF